MQIVIDIPKELYESYECRPPMLGDVGMDMIAQSIANGTPLPEGHGDLVDISPYKGKVICSHLYSGVKKLIEVDSIKPIIEAEEGEEE